MSEKTSLKSPAIVAILILLYVSICIEADINVPSFPDMVNYFGTNEEHIQTILSANFLGMCLAGLLYGTLADSFGRRKTILNGLFVFCLSSVGCVFAKSFELMLFFRFLQGVGAAAPMVVGFSVILDLYTSTEAAALVGVMNTVITGAMAGAPILGSWLNLHFGWRSNFILLAVLGMVSLVAAFLVIPETLPESNRPKFSPPAVARDFLKILVSWRYISRAVVCSLLFSSIIVYIANMSLVFLNHLKVDQRVFGFYQATTMVCFGIASFIGSSFIRKYGTKMTKEVSLALNGAGALGLFLVSLFLPTAAFLMCFFMGLVGFGTGIGLGSFATAPMEVFKSLKGASSAMLTSTRLVISSVMLFLSEKAFNGSMLPAAGIILFSIGTACFLYLISRSEEETMLEGSSEATPEILF